MKKYLIVLFTVLSFALIFCSVCAGGVLWSIDFSGLTDGVSYSTSGCMNTEGHLLFYTRGSSAGFTFNLPPGDLSGYSLRITDRGTVLRMSNASPGIAGIDSPVDITINNIAAVNNIAVDWFNDTAHTYYIGNCLKAGKNTITISLDPYSNTKYELKKVELIAN
ncbi:MAG: hypothetical protein ABIH00_11660 [Armatimonadota bacterium]